MKQSNKLETYGNEVTMNMNNILYQNIQASPYFKQLYEKKTYHEVIDEIYNHVESLGKFFSHKDLEVFATKNLLLLVVDVLWTLRLSVKQVKGLIDHTDSPHIRALGFLYLRYVCKPADLWEWFEPYLDDEEEIQIQGGSRPVIITMGKVARQLLLENKWLGTILPRIPVPIAREIEQKIKEQTKPLPTPQGIIGADSNVRFRSVSSSSVRRRFGDNKRLNEKIGVENRINGAVAYSVKFRLQIRKPCCV
ncbi:8591_t:CDS:2 [Paraglomus brasilianum]|uniref:Pre-mRNA-splicing factor 38 n=1 Tax=Paraglomus brasilianum TaxID=144538 RepID=A0A9N9G9P3_9GLOM|nr:8591_t:CDS:2 [Paraglomus brasilianum]